MKFLISFLLLVQCSLIGLAIHMITKDPASPIVAIWITILLANVTFGAVNVINLFRD